MDCTSSQTHLISIVQNLGRPRVIVLGDLILDRYTWGDAERVSQEAPVILLRADQREVRLGGAGNVGNMLHALGAEVILAGVVGEDPGGRELRCELDRLGIAHDTVIGDPSRPTSVKERFLGRAANRHPHQMLRVDSEVRDPLGDCLQSQLIEAIESCLATSDILLVSDYGKGVCQPKLLRRLIESARRAGVPVLVDPIRGQDYSAYRGATAITPNRFEAELASGEKIRTPADALPIAERLCQTLELEAIVITLDRDGAALAVKGGRTALFPTKPRQVYDITGAGDMVLSVIGMCLAVGTSFDDAVRLSNVAGGLEVEKIGVAVILPEEIVAELAGTIAAGSAASKAATGMVVSLEDLERAVQTHRRQGARIALTNGCFDLLHVGHVTYLEQAAQCGDCLIVAINSDRSVQRLKGPSRPVVPEGDRARMLAALAAVDYVVVFDEDTPHDVLRRIRPDVLVKGGTYTRQEVVGREVVESYGGEVTVVGMVEGVSTSRLIEIVTERSAPIAAPHFLPTTSEGRTGKQKTAGVGDPAQRNRGGSRGSR